VEQPRRRAGEVLLWFNLNNDIKVIVGFRQIIFNAYRISDPSFGIVNEAEKRLAVRMGLISLNIYNQLIS
jgi:hypothetical protein